MGRHGRPFSYGVTMDRAIFFKVVRGQGLYGPKLEQSEVDGTEAVLDAMEGSRLSHCAYALATALHETNKTMEPVREAYWLPESWRKAHLRYYPWYGRGYVQLTWERNYRRADRELGLEGTLIARPDLAMRMDIAAKIMRRGMDEGWFTGLSFPGTLPDRIATTDQFKRARKIINGNDRAALIAEYAGQFQHALIEAGWL